MALGREWVEDRFVRIVELVVEVAGRQLVGKAPQTGKWDEFKGVTLDSIEIAQPGEQLVTVRPKDAKTWKAINLRSVRLSPVTNGK